MSDDVSVSDVCNSNMIINDFTDTSEVSITLPESVQYDDQVRSLCSSIYTQILVWMIDDTNLISSINFSNHAA